MTEQHATTEKLMSDIRELIADAEELIKETGDSLSDQAQHVRKRLEDNVERAKSQLHHMEHIVRDRAVEGVRETDRVIRQHPYEALGAAFGVGLLLGVLFSRK